MSADTKIYCMFPIIVLGLFTICVTPVAAAMAVAWPALGVGMGLAALETMN